MTPKSSTILGWLYIATGLLVNPWFVARVLSPDGRIESASTIGAICVLEVLLVGLGVLTIAQSHRTWVANLNLLLWTLVITVPILGEVAFRTGIALKIQSLRRPHLYANGYVDDDFWLLQQRWGSRWPHASPGAVHELLGWSQTEVTTSNPLGLFANALSRLASPPGRPSSLATPSSAERRIESSSFLSIATTVFSGVEVVDLSVGGFGLDQIYLMFHEINPKASSLSLLGILVDDDLDRTVLGCEPLRNTSSWMV